MSRIECYVEVASCINQSMWKTKSSYDNNWIVVPAKNGQKPNLPIVAKHFLEVIVMAQMIAIFVRTANAKYWCSKGLCNRTMLYTEQ